MATLSLSQNIEIQELEQVCATVHSLLDDAKFVEAEAILAGMPLFSDIRCQRTVLHLRALLEFQLGHYKEAANLLENARCNFGTHIKLHADLAASRYMLGDLANAERELLDLEHAWNESTTLLSSKTAASVLLLIGNLREEFGDIAKAAEAYEQGFAWIEQFHKRERSPFGRNYYLFLIQRLRLAAEFGDPRSTLKIYRLLLDVGPQTISLNLHFEAQHALILAEAVLKGPMDAWQRLSLLLKERDLLNSEKRLVIFDLLYFFLRADLNAPIELQSFAFQLKKLDAFEETLLYFLQEKSSVVEARQKASISFQLKYLGLTAYLRLLLVMISRAAPQERKTLEAEFSLFVSAFSGKSQNFWKLQLIDGECQTKVLLASPNSDSLVLECGTNSRSWKKLQKSASLLELFLSGQREFSLETVTRSLWQATYNESYYHRLRILVRRTNQEIFREFSIPHAIRINTEFLSLATVLDIQPKKRKLL